MTCSFHETDQNSFVNRLTHFLTKFVVSIIIHQLSTLQIFKPVMMHVGRKEVQHQNRSVMELQGCAIHVTI